MGRSRSSPKSVEPKKVPFMFLTRAEQQRVMEEKRLAAEAAARAAAEEQVATGMCCSNSLIF